MNAIFVTGTDTGIGKTFVTALLLDQFNRSGYKTFAIKPIASGTTYNEKYGWENDDVLVLQKAASIVRPLRVVNPITLKEPIAPHLAALHMDIQLTNSGVRNAIVASIQIEADINFIEGVGGWAVPLNNHELFSEVICALSIPVILVVGIKLGCLNHAILTYHTIIQKNVQFVGWVANCLDPKTLALEENIQTLQEWIKSPCLGIVPYECQSSDVLNIKPIQQLLF